MVVQSVSLHVGGRGLLVRGQPRLCNETLSQTKQALSLLWRSGVAGAVPGTIGGNSFYP